ncbi:MAG: hypothetical protein QOE31_1186 [Solirubrobacteraceae bacterium]|jgi:hypothetical protein|nr:hypothetical protein [Solirubrobacteraceae bacterium]
MELRFGQNAAGLVVGGRELRAAVCDENEVRAAAGVTLAIAAVAFSYAYFDRQYLPLQVASSFFLVEFVLRTTLGIRYSPVGVVARRLTRGQAPDWVSAKPKRFAWTIGVAMAFAMTIITNAGIRGTLPRTLCLTCLTLMWMESALGLCLGCKIYAWLVRHGYKGRDPEIEVCAGGVCALPTPAAARDPTRRSCDGPKSRSALASTAT